MKNNHRQEIENQLVAVWKRFQPKQPSRDLSASQDEIELLSQQTELDESLTQREGYSPPEVTSNSDPSISTIAKIAVNDLFSDVVAPISKLNLPNLTVDPRSAFWAVLAGMVGGTGITSYLLLIAVPPTPSCQGVIPISTDSERLYCAQVGADTRELPKLRTAVNLVQGWTDRHPLYGEAQRLLKSWSEDLMRIGQKQLSEGKIEQAIATVKIVPASSSVYDRAQEKIVKWSIQAQDSTNIDLKFARSIKAGDWHQAFVVLQTVQRMRGSYWNGYKHNKMAIHLIQERDAWEKLQAAKDAIKDKKSDSYAERAKRMELAVKAAEGKGQAQIVEAPLPTTPEPIVKAMKLANQIDPKTYVYQEGQALRSKWSKHLVQLNISLYKTQNFNEAIAIVQKVPQDVSIYPEAQDWVKLNQAHVWAGKRHMLAMLEAIAQVKKIPKTSSIYTLARTKQSNWQGMLKQQTQLQWAKTIASFQQPATLALAIETARQVPAESDAGRTIQSEISTWSWQIETVDNRVILAKTRQIVSSGESLANLKAAVRIAGHITKDRPLGVEITGLVARWNEKIQTIEDRPILASAIALAVKGNRSQAIAIASQIAAGRPLYQDAQAEIRYWNLELQEIADRQTLDRAVGIYHQGKVSTAIDLAATIGRRSPIYGDARSYVIDWRLLLTPRSSY